MEGVNKQTADGGWIPVIHKHSRLGGFIDSRKPLISLFVDNLPEDTSQSWLKMMFNTFGVVKDVFIPEKRSKATGNRFGFIRYDCPVSADLAILRTNGVWLDDKKLFVKLAAFEAKRNRPISSHSNREGVILKAGIEHNNEQGSKANVLGQNLDYSQQGFLKDKKTYAQVTRGVECLGEQNARKRAALELDLEDDNDGEENGEVGSGEVGVLTSAFPSTSVFCSLNSSSNSTQPNFSCSSSPS
ncbi:hypothetical protein Vadar_020749 [Vaccinium darrowii]|uniref:Uncharacterized protein n=1 Tax=Vaccinium darrowii TaxID=229202 RepID=A0ACB7ZLF2_9ERIC|nr:hypothetical protein Vadar_020749 [Vaccinium darrowii]